nr:MAG TPA: hypothetical protein [Caudoviricetes sp.]
MQTIYFVKVKNIASRGDFFVHSFSYPLNSLRFYLIS